MNQTDKLFDHIMKVFDGSIIGRNCWTCVHNSLGTLTLFGICKYDAKWGSGPPVEITPELVDKGCTKYLEKRRTK